jgi:hypothetical protein
LPRHLGHANRLAQQIRLVEEESPASLSMSFEESRSDGERTHAPQRRAA